MYITYIFPFGHDTDTPHPWTALGFPHAFEMGVWRVFDAGFQREEWFGGQNWCVQAGHFSNT
jgi:hypothetical protein